MNLRPEAPEDFAEIRALDLKAFAPSELEAEITKGLRRAFGITTHYDAPPEAWMALPLPAYEPHIRGAFHYAPAFGA